MTLSRASAECEDARAGYQAEQRYYSERRLNSALKKAVWRAREESAAFAAVQSHCRKLQESNARLSMFYTSRTGELIYKAELQVAVLAQARRDIYYEIEVLKASISKKPLIDVPALEQENAALQAALQSTSDAVLASKIDYGDARARFSLRNYCVLSAPKRTGFTEQQIRDFILNSEKRFSGMPGWMALALSLTLNNAQFLGHFGIADYRDCGPAVGFHFLSHWTQALSARLERYMDDIYCGLQEDAAFKLQTFSALCWGWRAADGSDGAVIVPPVVVRCSVTYLKRLAALEG